MTIESEIKAAASSLFDADHNQKKPMDLLSAADTQEALQILRKDAAALANPINSANFDSHSFPFIKFDRTDGSLSITEGIPDGARTIKAKPYSVEISDENGAKDYSVKQSAERRYYNY
jgi:hypothetical protein